MKSIPLVSIIVPCYNAEKWIVRTLQSIFWQTYTNFELIIVDDGSTDSSLHLIEKYTKENPQIYFQLIILLENKGAPHALEIGRKSAKGDFIQYLDSDDVLPPEKIETQVNALIESEVDIAYADYVEVYENGQTKPSRYAKTLSNYPQIDFLRNFWRPPACFLFSKEITQKIIWNDSLKIFYDVAYYLSVSFLGAKFIHTPNLIVAYQVHQNSLSRKNGLIAYFEDYFQLLVHCQAMPIEGGQLDALFKAELIEALRDCAKAFVHRDNRLFHATVDLIEVLNPNYIPEKSLKMRFLSKIFGYRKAEILAAFLRKYLP